MPSDSTPGSTGMNPYTGLIEKKVVKSFHLPETGSKVVTDQRYIS